MGEEHGGVGHGTGEAEVGVVAGWSAPELFISYRRGRDGDGGRAMQLRDELAERFGADRVFFDVARIEDGDDFVDEIDSHIDTCEVLIVVVGPRWLDTLKAKSRAPLDQWRKDYVRLEIEGALKRGSDVRIVPVLVDGADPLLESELPRTLSRLGRLNARTLSHANWERDVDGLIDSLERGALRPEEAEDPPLPQPPRRRFQRTAVPYPVDASHLADVAGRIVGWGSVVPVLGPGVNAADRAAEDGAPDELEYLRDADDELADRLVERFGYEGEGTARLAALSEYARWLEGVPLLYDTLRAALQAKPPTSVHRFFAGLPRALRELGAERPYQMIVTTNYDDALERAFDDANEHYDLAVYVGSGEHAGRFVHVPYDLRYARPVIDAAKDNALPIDPEARELERTVIVKVHGSVHHWPVSESASRPPEPTEDCVITEDNYIDYLTSGPVESLVPYPILNQLVMSELLFLGYNIRDWSLRVLLQRMWRGKHGRSWAIQRARIAEVDDALWREGFGVKVYSAPLADYVRALGAEVEKAAEVRVG